MFESGKHMDSCETSLVDMVQAWPTSTREKELRSHVTCTSAATEATLDSIY
ncbi:hypothetical protein SAY86_007657 [Trapa natans]|uniref:Uncharacterized protein n=1 Tax=Trapa natans TaxID=22666 RepID=A0AAN7L8Q1_TRANT|nr:hypothetical protein SAY86_007657 [Trapa natans]